MDYHQHARLTLFSRELLAKKVLEQGLTLKLAAASFNVSAKTAAKWVRRYQQQGVAGLGDRSSRPRRLRQPRHRSWSAGWKPCGASAGLASGSLEPAG